MGSITQIYSSTQEEHKNTSKTLSIEASLPITPVYQYSQKWKWWLQQVNNIVTQSSKQKQQISSFHRNSELVTSETKTQAWGDVGVLHE